MTSLAPKRQHVFSNVIQYNGKDEPKSHWARLKHILREQEEEAVLGSILQDPSLFIQVANRLQGADFFSQMRGWVWFAFDQLTNRKEGIDILNVANELEGQPKCPLKGDDLLRFLTDLISAPCDRNNIEHYANRVHEAALKIRMLIATDAIRDMVYEERDLDTLIDSSNKLLFTATEQHRVEETNAKAIVSELWDRVEQLMGSGQSPAIPTGFDQFDELSLGAMPGEVMVVAGSEKSGKTTLLISWIRNMLKNGHRVLFFSLEMSKLEIMALLIAMESGIYRNKLRTGHLSSKDWALFTEAAGRVQQWPLDIEDQYPALTPMQCQRLIRFHQAQHPVDVVAIDGLWLMDADSEETDDKSSSDDLNKSQNRPRAVFYIMRSLTKQAKDFYVPILITHQYRGQPGKGAITRRPPTLDDLAESAGVRRNAQKIVGLHRAKKNVAGVEVDHPELHILGDRNGGSQGNVIELTYDKMHACYAEAKP